MRDRPGNFETYHLTCMVCGALPGMTCVDGDQERAEVHPSRRMSIAERNWRTRNGWKPPELAERRRRRQADVAERAPLFNPWLGLGVVTVLKGQRVTGRRVRLAPVIRGRRQANPVCAPIWSLCGAGS